MKNESDFLINAAKNWIKNDFRDHLDTAIILKIAELFSNNIKKPIERRYKKKKSLLYLWIGSHFPELRKAIKENPISLNYVTEAKEFPITISPPPVLEYMNRKI